MRFPRLLRFVVPVVLAACAGNEWGDANVVVIAIDTLRADHVGAYGYPRPTTPHLDRLAADGLVFETAVSQSSWTLPAFASIFTGRLPSYHRAGEGRFPAVSRLDDSHETLATLLAAEGYRTASFVSNAWVGADVGMTRGFDRHEQAAFSGQAVDKAVGWLREERAEPFFLFVHIIDPHQPYMPLAQDLAEFADPLYAGPVGTSYMGSFRPEWTPADRRRVVDLYDGEVRWADRLAGRVLDALRERRLDERTIVVFTSDHGEELFDHESLGHGHTLYDELLLVPLVIRFPGGPRGRVTRPVRTMDLFSTLLDAVGHPVPADVEAVSLMPLVRGGQGSTRTTDVALAEYVCFGDDIDLKAVRTPTEKLIFSPPTARARLFDLVADPHERRDLAAARPESTAALREVIRRELVASLDGFHLIARGGLAESVLRVRLVTVTGFRDVELSQPEDEDAFRLSAGGRVLDLKLRLWPRAKPVQIPDVDGVRFRVVDDRHVVVRRLAIDGGRPPRGTVTVGAGHAPADGPVPKTFGPTTPKATVPYPQAPRPARDGRPRVQFSYVLRGEAPTATVSSETRERLRALGYLP
jgi:arylsulfatase A-like enzyme